MGQAAASLLKALALCLLVALLASACQPAWPASQGRATPTPDASNYTVVVALAQAPTSLDPADHRSRASETVIRAMFDGLVTRDSRSTVSLELAEDISWLDELTLKIVLRQGVLFHDGVEMTADDVVFTFNRIIQENAIEYPAPHSSPRRSLVAPLASIEKVDDYTVVMHLSAPWPPAMQMLVHQQIVPRHYVEAVGTQGFIEHPIGSGPFKFVSASPNLGEVVLERFAGYYKGEPGRLPPGGQLVQRVIFRVVPDAAARAAALRIGEVDIIQPAPLEFVQVLEDSSNVQIKTAPGTQPKWMEMNVTRPPFDDVRVRQALNYAVDKQRLIDEVYDGRAVALPGALSPFNNFVSKELEPYPYDPDKAVALLAQAGWLDSNGDGVLDRGGQPFAFALDTLEEWLPLATALASQFRSIGLSASVRVWEYSIIEPQLRAGERLAYLDDWGDSAFDPVGHFEAKWHACVEGQAYGRGNYSGYDNPRVNQLIRLGESTADPLERQKVYDEAQRIIYDEAPAVFLVLPEEVEAALVRLGNWEPASDSRIHLYEVYVVP